MSTNPSRRQLLKRIAVASIAGPAALSGLAHARSAKPLVYTRRSSNKALEGYDPLSYFQQPAPVKGDKRFSVKHLGAQWLFSTEANLDAFINDPDAFMPKYGGYCAFSVARGNLVKGDPTLYAIVDNHLYVNFNKGVHARWLAKSSQMIDKAESNWPSILG